MLTCKITLPDSPRPVISSRNPGFRALYLAQQHEFRIFRLINTKKFFFSFSAAGFCPKNLPFARKIMALPESGGCILPSPLTHTPMVEGPSDARRCKGGAEGRDLGRVHHPQFGSSGALPPENFPDPYPCQCEFCLKPCPHLRLYTYIFISPSGSKKTIKAKKNKRTKSQQ